MRRKVSGERIAAAIVDALIVTIIAFIPAAILGVIYGLDGVFEIILLQDNPLEPTSDYITFMVITIAAETVIGIMREKLNERIGL